MTYCSSCGRASPDGVRFCAHCGIALPAPVLGYETPAAPAIQPAPVAARPVGRTQEPAAVLLLVLVTLGVYGLFWWWRISREADAYAGRPGRAHGVAKAGILTLAVAWPVLLVAYMVLIGGIVASAYAAETTGAAEPTAEEAAMLVAPMLVMLVAAVASLVGQILLYVGKWRVWRAIEEAERAQGRPSPLSPGLMLFFVLMPYVSIVTLWIAYHRTQKGLNALWAAEAAAPPLAAPPLAAR